jgi:hypothetical protein
VPALRCAHPIDAGLDGTKIVADDVEDAARLEVRLGRARDHNDSSAFAVQREP